MSQLREEILVFDLHVLLRTGWERAGKGGGGGGGGRGRRGGEVRGREKREWAKEQAEEVTCEREEET